MHTVVTFVLFPTASQYIGRSITVHLYVEQNILLCSTYIIMITVVSGHTVIASKSAELHCGG